MIQYWVLIFVIGGAVSFPTENVLTNGQFSTDLYHHMKEVGKKNFVISPASIHTLLGLTYIGTEGQTAKEIENVLHLSSSHKEEIANNYANLLISTLGPDSLMKMANKIYVNEGLKIVPHFKKIAEDSFGSEIENINFKKNDVAVQTINKWIEDKTNNKIKNLLSHLDQNSQIVLVNAIHFKGEWKVAPGLESRTFFDEAGDNKLTKFLAADDDDFKYGKFPKLNAVAAELPYKNSNLSLMIILPNEDSNLNSLETKLTTVNLIDLSKAMTSGYTQIKVPEFEITTKLHMTSILKSMGINALFTKGAEINLVDSPDKFKVADVVTEVFINVNSKGTEAEGATGGVVLYPISSNSRMFLNADDARELFADRPFMFAIKDDNNIYFTGHVRTVKSL